MEQPVPKKLKVLNHENQSEKLHAPSTLAWELLKQCYRTVTETPSIKSLVVLDKNICQILTNFGKEMDVNLPEIFIRPERNEKVEEEKFVLLAEKTWLPSWKDFTLLKISILIHLFDKAAIDDDCVLCLLRDYNVIDNLIFLLKSADMFVIRLASKCLSTLICNHEAEVTHVFETLLLTVKENGTSHFVKGEICDIFRSILSYKKNKDREKESDVGAQKTTGYHQNMDFGANTDCRINKKENVKIVKNPRSGKIFKSSQNTEDCVDHVDIYQGQGSNNGGEIMQQPVCRITSLVTILSCHWTEIIFTFLNSSESNDESFTDQRISRISLLNLWKELIKLSFRSTKQHTMWEMTKLCSVFGDFNLLFTLFHNSNSMIIWRHGIAILNKAVSFGKMLTETLVLTSDHFKVAKLIMRSFVFQRLLDKLPYRQGFVGFGGTSIMSQDGYTASDILVSCDGDLPLLRKTALLILRSLAISVKERKFDDSSFSHDNAFSSLDYVSQFICGKGNWTTDEWLFNLYESQDDALIEALLCLLEVYSGMCCKLETIPKEKLEVNWNPHFLFSKFLRIVSFDHSVLLDLIISPETYFLVYLMKYLRYMIADWTNFSRSQAIFNSADYKVSYDCGIPRKYNNKYEEVYTENKLKCYNDRCSVADASPLSRFIHYDGSNVTDNTRCDYTDSDVIRKNNTSFEFVDSSHANFDENDLKVLATRRGSMPKIVIYSDEDSDSNETNTTMTDITHFVKHAGQAVGLAYSGEQAHGNLSLCNISNEFHTEDYTSKSETSTCGDVEVHQQLVSCTNKLVYRKDDDDDVKENNDVGDNKDICYCDDENSDEIYDHSDKASGVDGAGDKACDDKSMYCHIGGDRSEKDSEFSGDCDNKSRGVNKEKDIKPDVALDKIMTVLIRFRISIEKLNSKSLFPYNVEPLIKLLETCEHLYESVNL